MSRTFKNKKSKIRKSFSRKSMKWVSDDFEIMPSSKNYFNKTLDDKYLEFDINECAKTKKDSDKNYYDPKKINKFMKRRKSKNDYCILEDDVLEENVDY